MALTLCPNRRHSRQVRVQQSPFEEEQKIHIMDSVNMEEPLRGTASRQAATRTSVQEETVQQAVPGEPTHVYSDQYVTVPPAEAHSSRSQPCPGVEIEAPGLDL